MPQVLVRRLPPVLLERHASNVNELQSDDPRVEIERGGQVIGHEGKVIDAPGRNEFER
jgi:hypothetical protein